MGISHLPLFLLHKHGVWCSEYLCECCFKQIGLIPGNRIAGPQGHGCFKILKDDSICHHR